MTALSRSQASAVARLFSATVMRELGRLGRSPTFTRLARELECVDSFRTCISVADFFERGFSFLSLSSNRHEYVYKSAVVSRILLGRHSLRTASMLSEFRVRDCKADIAILNGTASVYEIKSERDSLSRLEHQIKTYRSFFASVNVLAGENHIDQVRTVVPDEVGLFTLTNRSRIRCIREPESRADLIDTALIPSCVRVDEAKRILQLLGVRVPDLPNTMIHQALVELFSGLDPTACHSALVSVLKTTRCQSGMQEFIDRVPASLRSIILTQKFSTGEKEKLTRSVHTPMKLAMEWG